MKRRIAVALAAIAIVASASSARADTYPTRSITVVVPYSAGGPSDVVARIVTEHMARTLGQSIVIENISGAGGTIGSGRVAAASPDGYYLLAGSMGSHVAAPVLTSNMKYNSATDFVAIGLTADAPAVIAARKDFPAETFQEFLAYLKANGDKVKQGHGGIGASSHMACLMFNVASGTKPNLIAYRGSGPAMNDVVAGHLDFMCEQSVSVTDQVAGGALKGFVVSANERLPHLPNVISAKEAGIDYNMSIWAGIFAPKGTSPAVVATLSSALNKALDDPAITKRLTDLGAAVPPKDQRSPEAFDKLVKDEIARWQPILKAASAN